MPASLTIAQIREFDRLASEEFGVAGLTLMEYAGRGVAEHLLDCLKSPDKPVVIVCGKGNNGGDGFVAARYLLEQSVPVRVFSTAAKDGYRGDAATNLKRLQGMGIEIEYVAQEVTEEFETALSQAEWALDAILGVGANGSPRPPVDSLIRKLNQAPVKRMAVDLPSGLDADSGEAWPPTFKADVTCTLVAAKPGLLLPAASEYVGRLEVIDLGAPSALMQRFGLG